MYFEERVLGGGCVKKRPYGLDNLSPMWDTRKVSTTPDPEKPERKPLEWVGASKADLVKFPAPVRKEMGHALHLAQCGERPLNAKPMRGFGGAGVLEIVESHDGNAYRAVYTVKFARAVFVLHAFQKKSKHGIATPKAETELIAKRLRIAAEQYQRIYGSKPR